jgi:hypothetical protein
LERVRLVLQGLRRRPARPARPGRWGRDRKALKAGRDHLDRPVSPDHKARKAGQGCRVRRGRLDPRVRWDSPEQPVRGLRDRVVRLARLGLAPQVLPVRPE